LPHFVSDIQHEHLSLKSLLDKISAPSSEAILTSLQYMFFFTQSNPQPPLKQEDAAKIF